MVETLRDELKECGGIKEVIGIEFLIAFFVSIISTIFCEYKGFEPPAMFYTTVFTASAAMLGLTITAYSLTLSIGSDNFKKVFYAHKSFKKIRIQFSITAIVLGFSATAGIVFCLIEGTIPEPFDCLTILIVLLPCLWGVFNIVMILSNTLRIIGQILANNL